jgi:hypothetical protein
VALTSSHHVAGLHRAAVGEPLDEHVHELVLVMVVEHVGQPIGGHPKPAREEAVLAVRDEVEVVAGRDGDRDPLRCLRRIVGPLEDKPDAPAKVGSHAPILPRPA